MTAQVDAPPRFLLLLPPAPAASDADLIKSAYGDSIRQVLTEVALASQESKAAAVLEIALACPHLLSTTEKSSFSRYATTQEVLARTYRLVCTIAARDCINVEDVDGVDVRVILVAWEAESHEKPDPPGYIPTLQDLSSSGRQWQYAFGVEDDAGTAMVKAFVQARGEAAAANDIPRAQQRRAGPGHSSENIPCIAVGGTFDHLHIGHKLLLTMTVFAVLDQKVSLDTQRSVIIGITGDELLKNKKFAEHLESWHERQKSVHTFVEATFNTSSAGSPATSSEEVNSDAVNGHYINTTFPNGLVLRCVEIGDPFGPTITERDIDALVISAETRAGGKAVNDKRVEQGWHPLTVLEVDVLDGDTSNPQSGERPQTQDFAGKISSTEIRRKLAKKGHSSSL
ncbi:hypothetical protein CAC42_6781 [Sphaceloma murrayae]|uniref:Cytidyltransferase-like domain-containing protein n=1 Tax=Sphaceloma murrayae TaxID=2082308 RepID=A0A2K1QGF9_9PEZI|nr:hypothetical protein CAC42_6781 [Sphaceloma murrayae]